MSDTPKRKPGRPRTREPKPPPTRKPGGMSPKRDAIDRWPSLVLLRRLDGWGLGKVRDYAAWLAGTAAPQGPVDAAVLAMPLLWRVAFLQRHVAGATPEEVADNIGHAVRSSVGPHLGRAYAAIHGYLCAVDPTYREDVAAYERDRTRRAYRPARAVTADELVP